MSFTSDDLESFTHFAQARLQTDSAESLEELVDLWHLEHPSAEQQVEADEAIRQGLADIEVGRYRPVDAVMEELRAKYSLPAQ